MFCTACGTPHPVGDLFCRRCGAGTHAVRLLQESESPPAASPDVKAPLEGYAFANIWLRFAALQIDLILAFGLLALVHLLFGESFDPESSDPLPTGPGQYVVWLAILAVYYLWMDASRWQGTLGKQAVGLRVTDLSGRRVPLRSSLLRLIVRPLAIAAVGVGFLILQAYPKKQTWYDRIAGHVVLVREEKKTIMTTPETVG
ncbi:MAG: hypothetical protein FJ039_08080 [Chloroflexi bacterium]|nr:hypothetical protein [Chloroflexota bacterium]